MGLEFAGMLRVCIYGNAAGFKAKSLISSLEVPCSSPGVDRPMHFLSRRLINTTLVLAAGDVEYDTKEDYVNK